MSRGVIFARKVFGADEFWTGRVDRDGALEVSPHRCDAFVFKSTEGALQTAETHRALRDSEEWRLVAR